MITNLRPSPIAGLWYEGDPKALIRSVDTYMDQAVLPDLEGEVIGVIAPHAGHRYSGPVAGYAFAALKSEKFQKASAAGPRLVAILSPYHGYHNAPFLTSNHEAYATPLGAVPVDRAALDELDKAMRAELNIGMTGLSNDPEHSLEIELPFLQRVLTTEWKLLPVMIRAQEPLLSKQAGGILGRLLKGRNALLVASTDLSHYYDQRTAQALDRHMLEQIESFDPERVYQAEASGEGFACGLGALTTMMWAARELGADQVKVIRHATSGDVTGDTSAVVGYGAAVILKTK